MQFSFPPASPSRWLKWSPPSSSWPSSTPPASASNPTSPSSMRCTSPSVSWQIQIEFLQFSLRKSHLQKQLSWDLRPWKGLASFRQYVEVGLGLIAWWEHFCKFSIYINGAQWGGGLRGVKFLVWWKLLMKATIMTKPWTPYSPRWCPSRCQGTSLSCCWWPHTWYFGDDSLISALFYLWCSCWW